MTSEVLIRRYGIKHPEKIQGYKEAQADEKYVWSPVHNAHFTQFGFLTNQQLDDLGLLNDRPESEFTFMKKETFYIMKMSFMENRKGSRLHCVTALRMWLKLNPHGNIMDVSKDELERLSRDIHQLRIILREMRSRCNNPNAMDYIWYGAKGIKVCDEWSGRDGSDKFVLWSLEHGYHFNPNCKKGDQLSIDRIDPKEIYAPWNCRWIPHRKNIIRSNMSSKRIHGKRGYCESRFLKNYKYREVFPDCITKGYGGHVDWVQVYHKHFADDLDKLEKWFKEQGISRPTFLAVRRRIRKEK